MPPTESVKINPWGSDFRQKMRRTGWRQGGELISLPPNEQAEMMKTLASVGEDVSKSNPALHEAYETVVAAAKRTGNGAEPVIRRPDGGRRKPAAQ